MKVNGKQLNKALNFVSKFNQNVTLESDENGQLAVHAEGGYGYGKCNIDVKNPPQLKIIISNEMRQAIPDIDEDITIYITNEPKLLIESSTLSHNFNLINSLFDCELRNWFQGTGIIVEGIERILYTRENDIWFYNGKIISGGGYRMSMYKAAQEFEPFTCSAKLFDVFPNPQKIVYDSGKICFYRAEEDINYIGIFPDTQTEIPQAIKAIADSDINVKGSAIVRNNKQELATLKLYNTNRADVVSNGHFGISIDAEIGYCNVELDTVTSSGNIDISVNLKYLLDVFTKQGDEINVAMEDIIGVDVLAINEENIKHIIVPLYRK